MAVAGAGQRARRQALTDMRYFLPRTGSFFLRFVGHLAASLPACQLSIQSTVAQPAEPGCKVTFLVAMGKYLFGGVNVPIREA